MCPCGSGRELAACCGALHAGGFPGSPEALMRSRWSAYALGEVDYILATTHPDGPHHRSDTDAWREDVAAFCDSTDFERLEVHGSGFGPDGAWVEFTAHLRQGAGDASFRERSRFQPHEGRWRYLDGTPGRP